jgi:hypothetical protein
MWPLLVVLDEPGIEVGLQLIDPAIKFLAERHAIELIEQRLAEALEIPLVCGLRALVRVRSMFSTAG